MIAALHDERQHVDALTVQSWLKARGRLAEIGGDAYLIRISDAAPAVAAVVDYAENVARFARQRRVLAIGQRLTAEGYGDVSDAGGVDDWAAKASKELAEVATGGRNYVDYQPIGDILADVDRERRRAKAENRSPMRVPTGLAGLDKKVMMRPKDLVVIGALPSMGKTALLGQILTHVTDQQLWQPEERMMFPGEVPHALLIALEMTREKMVERILCGRALVSKRDYERHELTGEEETRVSKAMDHLQGSGMFIADRPAMKVDDIVRNVRACIRESEKWRYPDRPAAAGRLRVVVVDYLTLLKFDRPKGITKSEVVGEATMALKNLAKSEDVLVILASQLNRDVTRRQGNNKPMMSDLRDSGEIEQAADTILFVHRDEVLKPNSKFAGFGEILIAKQREGEIGRVFLRWTGSATRFVDLSYEDHETLAGLLSKEEEPKGRRG